MADNITIEEFKQLLERSEGCTLDFKREMYDWSNNEKKLELVKDILCMANTVRQDPAYIVMGVDDEKGVRKNLLGVLDTSIIDETIVRDYLRSKIQTPLPDFHYEVVQYDGKKFIVIRINAITTSGPFFVYKDEGKKLRKKDLYFRDGASNAVALNHKAHEIYQFFGNEPKEDITDLSAWEKLWSQLNELRTDYHYVLVTTPLFTTEGILSSLGKVPWVTVIDFDPSSDSKGLLYEVEKPLTEQCHRSIYRIVKEDALNNLNPQVATFWFFARGLEGRQETLQTDSWSKWDMKVGSSLAEFVKHIARFCQSKPVTCLILGYDGSLSRHLDTTISSLRRCFQDAISFVLVTDDTAALASLSEEYEIPPISIPLKHVCAGLSRCFTNYSPKDTNDIMLPSSSGTPVPLQPKDAVWIAEELEIVHLNILESRNEYKEKVGEFLKGARISWDELELREDIERDIQRKLEKSIEQRLDKRRAEGFNLLHDAGAGGTTLGYRILWMFHESYPCAILHSTQPQQTASRIEQLTGLTELPVLLLVDSADVSPSKLDELYDNVKSRNVPVVILTIQRTWSKPKQADGHLHLDRKLTDREKNRFLYKYGERCPERKKDLERCTNSGDCSTAFHFGLYAFLDNFKGIPSFVKRCLEQLSDPQKTIIVYLSLAYYYAQRPISSQAFANLIHTDPKRIVELSKILPDHVQVLLQRENNMWRPIHHLVAEEILHQVLTPQGNDPRNWKYGLSECAKSFADFCRGNTSSPTSEEMLEIARRVFIYRDNDELLGTELSGRSLFSRLIEDIKSVSHEGASSVLRHLSEIYPEEPHFHAHLGRFVGFHFKDYVQSVELIDRAIYLSGSDSVLHHMKGMAIRKHIEQRFEDSVSIPEVPEIVQLVQRAKEAFKQARSLKPESEHGYISEAHLLVKVLDYVGKQHERGIVGYLQSREADPVFLESVQHIEDLLEHVRRNQEGKKKTSDYEARVRAELESLFGPPEQALMLWDRLLNRQTIYKPPVRRNIIWTYLARHKRIWANLSLEEIERTIKLLEENLSEEPNNSANLRLWIQAIRFSGNVTNIEEAIERVSYWKSQTSSLEATYYLYVLYSLQAIEGSAIARDRAIPLREESANYAVSIRHRTKSYEWLGKGVGLQALVNHSLLGDWDTEKDFWKNTDRLRRVDGVIKKVRTPRQGTIELQGGLDAFFVPGKKNPDEKHTNTKTKNDSAFTNVDTNRKITCYLGFSYDGLRAWDVKLVDD